MKNGIIRFGDIFKLASEEGGTVVVPIRMKKGRVAKEDKGLFKLLSFTGESDRPIFKVVEVTENRISLEISPDGVSNMAKAFASWEGDVYQDKSN